MRQRKRAGARPPTRLSPGAAARQGPVPEDFSGEALPSRSSSRPARSRRHSGRSEIMPSSLEISQTRYAAPGLRRVGGRAPARHAGARPLTPRCLTPPAPPAAPAGASCRARACRRRCASTASRWYRSPHRSPHPRPRRRRRRAAAAGAPTRVRARERPRGAPSRGAHRTPPPAAARDRSATSRTATNSTSSAGSSTSAARSGPRKWPPHCVRRGRRDQLGDIHLGERRRAQCARTTSPSADAPPSSARARVDAPTATATLRK